MVCGVVSGTWVATVMEIATIEVACGWNRTPQPVAPVGGPHGAGHYAVTTAAMRELIG